MTHTYKRTYKDITAIKECLEIANLCDELMGMNKPVVNLYYIRDDMIESAKRIHENTADYVNDVDKEKP